MSNSTHKAEVVPVNLRRHDGSDHLSIADVYGYTCVCRTEDWQSVEKAVYIPPDSLVPVNRPEFAFLAADARADGLYRVKARKLRGVLSFGLLVPAPADAVLGDDLAESLGVVHYDPEIHSVGRPQGGIRMGGEVASAPNVYHVKYDVESGRRYAKGMFQPDEMVVVTEKVHGANSRYVFSGGVMHCGSRTEWKKEYPTYSHLTVESLAERTGSLERAEELLQKLQSKTPQRNMWWTALSNHPEIRYFCERYPDLVVYAECYGAVQDLGYGHKKGEVSLAIFDLMRDGRWLDHDECEALRKEYKLPWVPLVAGPIPFDFDKICEMAEGKTLFPGANHVREGVVVRPVKERRHDRYSRCVLKWVGAGYLERSKDTSEDEME